MSITKISTLWRYPVKSLLGEKMIRVDIDSRGLCGDRAYALLTADGKLASGKDTRRFKRIDGMFSLSAKTSEQGLAITFPDGSIVMVDDPSLNRKLSETLGLDVTLTQEAAISHFDDGAVHLVTTTSLSSLQKLLPTAGIAAERFRPNMVIDSLLSDRELVGKILKIGGVRLAVSHKTERCRMITLAQPGMASRPDVLKVVAGDFDLDFGVYAHVLTTGPIAVGDEVEIS